MDKTREFIIDGLIRFGLADFAGRPYDCAFELLAAPASRKRLIMIGFNGSSADSKMNNKLSILKDHANPCVSNVHLGTQGTWGITHLAKRLQQIPISLGYNWEDVVYTNALLMCSSSAASLKVEANKFNTTVKDIIERSMAYFEHITIPLCEPDMIIAYSNGLQSISAASLLLKHFGDPDTLCYAQKSGYYTTYAFSAKLSGKSIPVICIRHMSRFKPNENHIKMALSLVRERSNVMS